MQISEFLIYRYEETGEGEFLTLNLNFGKKKIKNRLFAILTNWPRIAL